MASKSKCNLHKLTQEDIANAEIVYCYIQDNKLEFYKIVHVTSNGIHIDYLPCFHIEQCMKYKSFNQTNVTPSTSRPSNRQRKSDRRNGRNGRNGRNYRNRRNGYKRR
jgi:hypothetical protein